MVLALMAEATEWREDAGTADGHRGGLGWDGFQSWAHRRSTATAGLEPAIIQQDHEVHVFHR